MNIRPLFDRVLLKPIEKENVTASGIYIPDGANKERPFIYEVIAIGPWKSEPITNIKVWDRVLAGQYAGDEVKVDGSEFKIVGLEYILGVIEK